MNKRFKLAGIIALFAIMLAFCSAVGVKAEDSLVVINSDDLVQDIEPGKTTHITIPVGVNYDIVYIRALTVTTSSKLLKVENLKLIETATGEQVTFEKHFTIGNKGKFAFDFDVVADESLPIGYYSLTIGGYGDLYNGMGMQTTECTFLTITAYNSYELEPVQLIVSDVDYDKSQLAPGGNTSIDVYITNEGDIKAINSYVNFSFDAGQGIIPDYTIDSIKLGDLKAHETTVVSIDVKVLPNATPGLKTVEAKLTCKNKAGESVGPFTDIVYVNVAEAAAAKVEIPELELSTSDNYKVLKKSSDDKIILTVKNIGEATAKSVTVKATSGFDTAIGMTKAYTAAEIKVGNLKAGESKKVEVPIKLSDSFAKGTYAIDFAANCFDKDSNACATATLNMYVVCNDGQEEVPDDKLINAIGITNVSQNPSVPVAGQAVNVSFTVTNNGNAKIDNFKICGTGYGSNSFEPSSSDPYINVGSIAAGASFRVTIYLKAGEDIPSGSVPLGLSYSYTDKDLNQGQGSETLYILNVRGADKVDVGRPKLIVTDYGTDLDMIKAGDVFDFTFTIKNTHASKAAKNIKITVSQANGVFTMAEGSNIFYIDTVLAGETTERTISLKAGHDTATGDYPLTLKFEYEYDEMSETDKTNGGVVENNEIQLKCTENYRPVIENVYIDAWETVYVGNPVDLSFEFYNMGKSQLGNVYVTVEGDFELANNSAMSYIGAIGGYSQEFVNPQVVPLVAGEPVGILTVHFEDSNGDEVSLSQEFSTYVEEMGGGDFGYEDWGEDFPGEWNPDFPEGEGEGEDGETAKFLGLPWWAWIIIGCVVVAAVVVVIIVVKKKKKNRLEEDDEDETD